MDPGWVHDDVIIKNGTIEKKWRIFLIGLSKERSWKARYGILDGRDQFPTVQGTTVGLPPSYQATAVTDDMVI